MSLGISIEKTIKNEDRLIRLMLITFALATPLGVLIGVFVSGADLLIKIVFLSFSVGTFTYISCSEVIVEEFAIPKY